MSKGRQKNRARKRGTYTVLERAGLRGVEKQKAMGEKTLLTEKKKKANHVPTTLQ